MPRPKSPDGKRVAMSARFSEAEAAEVDRARGNTDRSAWLRDTALAAARQSDRVALPTDVITIIPDERMPPGVAALCTPGQPPAVVRLPEPEAAPRKCRHAGMRMSKGVCPDCHEWVSAKT